MLVVYMQMKLFEMYVKKLDTARVNMSSSILQYTNTHNHVQWCATYACLWRLDVQGHHSFSTLHRFPLKEKPDSIIVLETAGKLHCQANSHRHTQAHRYNKESVNTFCGQLYCLWSHTTVNSIPVSLQALAALIANFYQFLNHQLWKT